MAVRHAAARSLVALSLLLAAGCGGGAQKSDAGDARDATPDVADGRDAGPVDRLAPAETGDDVPPQPGDGDDGAGDGRSPADGNAGGDAADTALDRPDLRYPSLCGMSRGTLRPGAAPVTGVLAGGAGANAVVSCGGGLATAGADAAYTLEVDTAGIVELTLDAELDVVLAIRTGCNEGVSEVACSTLSLASTADAADGGAADAAPPAGAPWRTGLRARLMPGTYTVLVDTVGIRQDMNPFTLSARTVTALPNASCATPVLLSAPGVTNQELSLGGEPSGACGGRTEATLYYTVGVPSGQRLTARATPRGGDRAWLPRLEASGTCAGTCLAQGHTAAGATQVLDWLNNGPNWRLVVLAVSADGAVNGARFDLAVSVVDQLATCARPTPVVNGTMLVGQDAQRAPIGDLPSCNGPRTRALYYAATLLPQQVLTATAAANPGSTPPALAIRTSCDVTECVGFGGSTLTYTNAGLESQTVLIEAQPVFSTASVFDLLISMPPPPAGVTVTAPFGLTTTEAGGTAKATIVLRSPPSAPVTIALASDTPGEGTVSPAALVFDATNWSVAQEVTVKGVDDQAADGPRRYTIVTGAVMSADERYKGMTVDDFDVINQDDDPGLSIEGAEPLVTSESGASTTFKVRLNRQPTGTVRVPLSSSDISEAAVGVAELVFTDANWSVAQGVTVTGVDDVVRDGTQPYSIVLGTLVSGDPAYAGQNPPDLAGLNRDDDQAAVGTKILSGDHSCYAPYGRPITTDLAGNIYVVMLCENELVVTTSTDAGATFSEPKVVAPGVSVNEVSIAGGPNGVAYLAYQSSSAPDGLIFRRTSDGGLTWSAGQALLPSSQGLRIAAAGDALFVTASPSDGGTGFLWRSSNGGRGALTRSWLERPNVELLVRPDGRTVFLAEIGPDKTRVRKSTDGGETFAVIGEINSINAGGGWAVTSTALVYAGGGFFNAYSLDRLSDSINYESFVDNVLGLAVDENELVTAVDVDQLTNRLRASRFDVTTPNPIPQAKLIGPYADGAAAVALSPRAVATVSWTGSLVLFAVTTWP